MSVTPADVDATIASEHYFTADDGVAEVCRHTPIDGLVHQALGMLTFCVLVLRNGHTVTGESYCQDPAKFNAQIGKDEARKAAIDKLWPMVVYASRAAAEPAQPAHKTYTWGDVARHEVNQVSFGNEIQYRIEMHTGQTFTGSVKPGRSYSAWQGLAIADINRQAAA